MSVRDPRRAAAQTDCGRSSTATTGPTDDVHERLARRAEALPDRARGFPPNRGRREAPHVAKGSREATRA